MKIFVKITKSNQPILVDLVFIYPKLNQTSPWTPLLIKRLGDQSMALSFHILAWLMVALLHQEH